MPIFSRTVQALNEAVEDKRSGVLELSRVILEDPTLTAKILRLSNTPFYNPGRQKLATVTRAVILIGLQVVRDLALTCVFIETLLTAHNREQVRRQIARALHAAVQARSIAILSNDPEPEEVFIGALLHNIGHIVFWCFAEEQGAEISKLVAAGMDAEQAERQVLGFRLRTLGAALSRRWKLGSLLDDVFAAATPGGRAELVHLGCALAEQTEKGWTTSASEMLIGRVSQLAGRDSGDLLALIDRNVCDTIKLATQFGAGECVRYLPVTASLQVDESQSAPAYQESADPGKDPPRLVQVLHDIAVLLAAETNPNLTVILELILEGCYRTLAMDRVLLALMDPSRAVVRQTAALGWPSRQSPILEPVQSSPASLVSHAIEQGQALWVRNPEEASFAGLFTPSIVRHFGRQECMIAAIGLSRRPIGLIYADRAHSQRALRQEDFDGFRQLTLQANIAFKLCR